MLNAIKRPVFGFVLTLASSIMMSGCVIHVNAKDHDISIDDVQSSYSSTNKRVTVPENASTGRIKSVNGRVEVNDHVSASKISSVNGKIEIGQHVTADEVSSVNGKIEIDQHFKANGDVSTVNGRISIDKDSTVEGNIETVNGTVEIRGVVVEQNIIAKNGHIKIDENSLVKGDIVFREKNSNNYNWNKPPTLFISADSKIEGNIILRREVNLEIENDAHLRLIKREY